MNYGLKMFCIGSALVSAMGVQSAPDAELQRCQKIKDRIEHYDQLRRKGGSGRDMDSWKRARRDLEKVFRDSGCRYYRWQLN